MTEKDTFPVYPGWETVRKLGSGSFGAVYEIQRDLFGKIEKAALKQISIPQDENDVEELTSTGYDEAGITAHYQGFLADIVKEYQLMAEMKGHTNVVYCDDIRYVQKDDGFGWDVYIKMELLTPLMKALDRVTEEREILKLGRDLANALVLCRSRNIIHRDIKPQNIFVSKDGDYKLGDFGIAKTAEKTSGGTKIGTYNYMAPEVYNNQPYGHGADIYSLGLVLYWLLNDRRLPFYPAPPAVPRSMDMEQARMLRFRGEPLPPPAHGSEAFKRIVLKACAFDPKDRYLTAEEMLRDLEHVGEGPEKEEAKEVTAPAPVEAPTAPAAPPARQQPIDPPPIPREQPIDSSPKPREQPAAPAKACKRRGLPFLLTAAALVLALVLLLPRIKEAPVLLLAQGYAQSEDGLFWKLEDGVLTIRGEGRMASRSYGDAPWFAHREAITRVTIAEGVTSIGDWAFYGCSGLREITIPKGVTSIGEFAFASCSSLTDVNFAGTRAQWEKIPIGFGNELLLNAAIHYNA